LTIWILWKIINVFSSPNSNCYISANLHVTVIKFLGHQTSIILFNSAKFHDVKFELFDMGSSQLFDFWQSEYCEKLTCILVTKFKLLNLHQFICHLHQTFRPSKQYHPLSRYEFHDVKFKHFDMGPSQLFDFLQSEYCEKLTMYTPHQIQAVIFPPIYTSPSSNVSALKPASSYFISPNLIMWNLNESIWDQVNFSVFDNLNIVKN
jgi:hypothetical protein